MRAFLISDDLFAKLSVSVCMLEVTKLIDRTFHYCRFILFFKVCSKQTIRHNNTFEP